MTVGVNHIAIAAENDYIRMINTFSHDTYHHTVRRRTHYHPV